MPLSWLRTPRWTLPDATNGLIILVMGQRRAQTVRRFIAAATVVVGGAGMVLLPSDGLRWFGSETVLIFAASTIPVGVLWYRLDWTGRYDWLFIVYADIGIVAVLCTFESKYEALPGAALLSLVSLFALIVASRAALLVHTGYAMAVCLWFAVGAFEQETDRWMVVSRLLTITALVSAPSAVQLYLSQIYVHISRLQRDPETGLFNRLGLESKVGASEPSGVASPLLVAASVAIGDFDGIGRRFGRAAQQEAVAETTELLHASASPTEVIARIAPGEFATCRWIPTSDVLLTDERDAESRLHGHVLTGSSTVLHCGVAHVERFVGSRGTDSGWTVQRALEAAELRRRSNTHGELHGHPLRAREITERIAARIRSVIDAGGPRIAFQPILATADLEVAGYEALARFPDGTGTTEQWFRDATSVGLGAELERSAIARALSAAQVLPPSAFLSVNVSAATLLIGDTPELLSRVADRQIVVELTEHEDVQNFPALRTVLDELRRGGVQIALDDVGAGFAGMRQLVDLGPDILKLDAFIVRGSRTDTPRRAAAEAITTFARRTGSRCVFEGIETAEDLESARLMGADLVQGFYLARPAMWPSTHISTAGEG